MLHDTGSYGTEDASLMPPPKVRMHDEPVQYVHLQKWYNLHRANLPTTRRVEIA